MNYSPGPSDQSAMVTGAWNPCCYFLFSGIVYPVFQAIKRGTAEDATQKVFINMKIKSVMTLLVTSTLIHSA